MKEISLDQANSRLIAVAEKLAKENHFDIKRDNFTLVQPLTDHQAIILIAYGQGKHREIKIYGNDCTFILPAKDEWLDIFEKESEDK